MGSTSAMSGSAGGGSSRHGEALRKMATAATASGTNTLIVTHKTNITDAFGNSRDFRLLNKVSAGTAETLNLYSNDTPFLTLDREAMYVISVDATHISVSRFVVGHISERRRFNARRPTPCLRRWRTTKSWRR